MTYHGFSVFLNLFYFFTQLKETHCLTNTEQTPSGYISFLPSFLLPISFLIHPSVASCVSQWPFFSSRSFLTSCSSQPVLFFSDCIYPFFSSLPFFFFSYPTYRHSVRVEEMYFLKIKQDGPHFPDCICPVSENVGPFYCLLTLKNIGHSFRVILVIITPYFFVHFASCS